MVTTIERFLIDPTGATYETAIGMLEFFSTGSIVLLIGVAVTFYNAGSLLREKHSASTASTIVAAFTLLLSFWYCHDSSGDVLFSLIRSLLASAVCFGGALMVCGMATIIRSYVTSAYRKVRRVIQTCALRFQTWREHRRTLRALRNQPQPTPPPPRSRVLRQWLKEAQKEFTLEAKLIDGTVDLDDDERQALLLASKQRYIQKMNGILQ